MEKVIFMSQMDVIESPDIMKTTLGSCIGLILFDKKKTKFGLVHIMLPRSNQSSDAPIGKCADTAVVALVKKMKVPAGDLKAIVTGGANMFQKQISNNTVAIGQQNIEAVKAQLIELSIPIVAEDVAGFKGRQVTVNAGEKKVLVNTIGSEPIILFE